MGQRLTVCLMCAWLQAACVSSRSPEPAGESLDSPSSSRDSGTDAAVRDSAADTSQAEPQPFLGVHADCAFTPYPEGTVAQSDSCIAGFCLIDCLSDADCAPAERCVGYESGTCLYGGRSLFGACETDADCLLPSARCETLGLLLGDAEATQGFCRNPPDAVLDCETDADCVDAADGSCFVRVESSTCRTPRCLVDSDCDEDQICECHEERGSHECVTATCRSDADCAVGERCAFSEFLYASLSEGYHCTKADDLCEPDAPCPDANAQCGWHEPTGRFECHREDSFL